MRSWTRIAWVWIGLSGISACSPPDPVRGVLRGLLEAGDLGLMHSALPPVYTGCARVQPGFDPGDPNAVPPVPPTVDGEPWTVERDGFCTLSFTRRVSLGGDGVARIDEHIYLVESGAPDPDVALPPHLEDLHAQLRDGPAHYCHFRYRVDAEPFEGYPEADVQVLTWTLEEVSEYCDPAYAQGAPYVPGHQVRETAIRSTDPDVFLFLPEGFAAGMGGTIRFQGYAGIPDTGGASAFGQPGGYMTFYEACALEPTARGPGVCATECRLFSPNADGSIPSCTWDDVGALPAHPGLIEPTWIDAYRPLYDEVHGG